MALFDLVQRASEATQSITAFIVAPLLIVFGGVIAGKIAGNLLLRLGHAVELDRHAGKLFGQPVEMSELASGGVAAIIYTVATVWALATVGILREAFLIVLGASLTLAAAAIALALLDVVPNLAARRRVRAKLSVGKRLNVEGLTGTVERLGAMSLRMRTDDGLLLVLPYSGL